MFNVSNRTVSRWENGINLPDIDLMIMILDYYEIDLRDLLDSERQSKKKNKEAEETVITAVDYINEGTKRYVRRWNWMLAAAVFWLLLSEVIEHSSLLSDMVFFSDESSWFAGAGCVLIILVTFTSNKKLNNRAYKYRQILLDE